MENEKFKINIRGNKSSKGINRGSKGCKDSKGSKSNKGSRDIRD